MELSPGAFIAEAGRRCRATTQPLVTQITASRAIMVKNRSILRALAAPYA